MESPFDPGALMARGYPLTRGPRVRLRLPRAADAPAIRELFEREGAGAGELEAARLLRFDPRARAVICATALLDGRETVLGVGAISLAGGPDAVPELLLVDRWLTEGLEELLCRALRGRAQALARTRAA